LRFFCSNFNTEIYKYIILKNIPLRGKDNIRPFFEWQEEQERKKIGESGKRRKIIYPKNKITMKKINRGGEASFPSRERPPC